MSLKETYLASYNAWIQAGGDAEEAFRFYLQGTGQIPITKDDVLLMIERTRGHLQEMENAVESLPLG